MPDEVQPEELFAKAPRRGPEQFEFVRYRIDCPVARLTLHRPEHNLLNESMLRELADGIGMLAEMASVKLIVLDAAGKVFSGAWISASTRLSARSLCSMHFMLLASPWLKPRSPSW